MMTSFRRGKPSKQNKVKLTLSIDKNILERARRKIPNLSAFFEIKVLEHLKLRNSNLTDPAGFEPATYGLEGLTNRVNLTEYYRNNKHTFIK